MNDKIKHLLSTASKTDSIAKNKWRIENREQLREQRETELKELMEKDKTMSNDKQTPKEKANELLDKMTMEIGKFNAKQCALIAVNEILSINSVDKDVELSDYWEEVKQEIENL